MFNRKENLNGIVKEFGKTLARLSAHIEGQRQVVIENTKKINELRENNGVLVTDIDRAVRIRENIAGLIEEPNEQQKA